MKISSRDVKIFILGFVSFLIVESIYDWKASVNAFNRGWNNVSDSTSNASPEKVK